jgi:hydrogenase maturation protease
MILNRQEKSGIKESFPISERTIRVLTLIIGYGNPLRSDDGLGWHAAEHLIGTLYDKHIRLIQCHQLLPELAEDISRADRVIFIDACIGDTPGKLICQKIVPDFLSENILLHHLTPSMLLAWVNVIYQKYPEAVVFSVVGKSFECGDTLSSEVQQAFDSLIHAVNHAYH